MDQKSLDTYPMKSRSRSNTSTSNNSRKRPQSRASTTSLQSGARQAPAEQQLETIADSQRQWYDPNAASQRYAFSNLGHQMTPEDLVMQSATQLQNPTGYNLDTSLNSVQNQAMSYSTSSRFKHNSQHQPLPTNGFSTGYADDSQVLDARSDEQDEVDSQAGTVEPTKKGSKASAANELEMRQLFQANRNRTLPEVALELHGNERGPQSERQRQIFAMIWINQVCEKGKASVPRGRVYAQYVSRCATERITVLNPASFGKLVRVLFPGLKTRRLGVRGESKYHYVNFSLKDDKPETPAFQGEQPVQAFGAPGNFVPNFSNNHLTSHTHYQGDRASFPAPDVAPMPLRPAKPFEGLNKAHSLYNHPEILDIPNLESSTSKIPQILRFASPSELSNQGFDPISLPKIDPFVPQGTDPDRPAALSALYRSHCTSLIECMRFCKEKTFFHLFTSFHGTLTMPVQKLFADPSLAPWIEQCDFQMYQKMMQVVAPLTLQVAPKPVLDTLRNISEKLVSHIQNSFQGHPRHVVDAKVAPATLFAGLLDRELRVNLTAHAAANMLSNPANRDQMYEDWITMVRTRKIAECVPTRGMDDVVNLFLTELRDLLDPMNVPWEIEGATPYGEMMLRTGRQQQASIHADSSTENVLDRWVNFLTTLPSKFPYATHAEIVWCVQRVGTAVMRDLTIAQGKSFGAWWVTKCWIDEMISFMAEQGGFMEYKSYEISRKNSAGQPEASRRASHAGSRYSSGSDEFLREHAQLNGSLSVSRPMDVTSQAAMNAAAGHDDSGIGHTPEDDFTMSKFDYGRDSTSRMSFNNLPHAMAAARAT